MPSKYPQFDRGRLTIFPLNQRENDVTLARVLPVGQQATAFDDPNLPAVADAVAGAVRRKASVAPAHGRARHQARSQPIHYRPHPPRVGFGGGHERRLRGA